MLNEHYATFAGSLEDADTPPAAQRQAMYKALHARLADELTAWHQLKVEGADTGAAGRSGR